jgi:hypothetical protein
MCKEMPVIPVNRVVDKRRIIGKNGGPRRRRGTRHMKKTYIFLGGLLLSQNCWCNVEP